MEPLEILLMTIVPVFIGSVIDRLSRKCFAAVLRSLNCNLEPEPQVLTWLSSQKPAKIKSTLRHEWVTFCSEFRYENVFTNELMLAIE